MIIITDSHVVRVTVPTPPGRPFRDLCPEADARDAMTEEDFWAHVYPTEVPEFVADDTVTIDGEPCRVCGEPGACAYDSEGNPLIHSLNSEDD